MARLSARSRWAEWQGHGRRGAGTGLWAVAACLLLLALLAAGCRTTGQGGAEPVGPEMAPPRTATLLHINDVYRIAGVDQGANGGIARVRSLRTELEKQAPDLLVLHAGDLLFPSLLSQTYNGAQMIDMLNRLDGGPGFDDRMFVTFGNHEFDQDKLKYAERLDRRVEDSQFRWLDTNLVWKKDGEGRPLIEAQNLVPTAIVESGGVKVGLFGLTTNLKDPEYVERFEDPAEAARAATAELRAQGAEAVVALTHLRMSEDRNLLATLGDDGPDLILGGHEHNCQSAEVGGRWVIKADAEARSASVVRLTVGADGKVSVEKEYRYLDRSVPEDPAVRAAADDWLVCHDRTYCEQVLDRSPGCLAEEISKTDVELVGEELEIRRYETNLGDWVLDQALAEFKDQGAQVAFINSGSLRLNQNLPAGSTITRRFVEELFPYPADLKVLKIRGETLQKVVSHAVEDWTGNGWWLQVAGMSFRHDPKAGTATELMLLTPDGPRPVEPDEEILAVTSGFLAGGEDGYSMLNPGQVVGGTPAVDLKDLVVAALDAAGTEGIAPMVEGRIVNTEPREGEGRCE